MTMTGFFRLVVPVALLLDIMNVSAAVAATDFTLQTLSPGVHAVMRTEPLGLANHANTVFIINDSDVVVVDTQFTLAATREVVAALKKLTDKPVSYLVNTHWHDDHTFGNQVWKEAYPGLEIISHERTRSDMATTAVENRQQQVDGGPEAIARFEGAVTAGKALDGSTMSPEELAAYESTIKLARTYVAEVPGFTLTLPTITFSDRMVLQRGGRTIEIRHLGDGVTRGDAVVWLPAEKILVAGDLVNDPFPFTYGGHVTGWVASLEAIRALAPSIIVPGHGPVQRDMALVDRLTAAFSTLRTQAQADRTNGTSEEDFLKSVALGSQQATMVGDNKMLAFLFRSYFVGPAATSAYRGDDTGR
ncbi:MAG: beta-lactamase [bacterium]|nr:MAG: beta-lactamase [bacterium]